MSRRMSADVGFVCSLCGEIAAGMKITRSSASCAISVAGQNEVPVMDRIESAAVKSEAHLVEQIRSALAFEVRNAALQLSTIRGTTVLLSSCERIERLP